MSRLKTVSEETISKAMEGDAEAFTEIFLTCNQSVFFMAVQYFKNEDTANDVVQEVFIKVHKQIHNLKSPKAFISWLHVITYRECQNFNRRKMRLHNLKEDESIEDFPDITSTNASTKLENDHIKEMIIESLETMKKPLRTVAVLRFFEELKLQEIADILDVPKSTVANRISRIKKKLSVDLEKKGIHKNYGISTFTPIMLHEAYSLICDKYSMNETSVNNTLQTILSGGSVAAGGVSLFTKLFLSSLASVTVLSGIVIMQKNTSEVVTTNELVTPSLIDVFEEKPSYIMDISYDDSWTNDAVYLDIKVSNNNYDKLLINDVETLKLVSNGDYIIQMLKDDKVIDEKEITISNIDKNSPTVTGEEKGNRFYVYLLEDKSGINKDSIEYYKNGTQSYDYIYYEDSKTIIIDNDISSIHEFYVSDNANNRLTIEVKLES